MISMAIVRFRYDKNVVCRIIIEHEIVQIVSVFLRTYSLEIHISSLEIRKSHSSLEVLGYPDHPNLQCSLVPHYFLYKKEIQILIKLKMHLEEISPPHEHRCLNCTVSGYNLYIQNSTSKRTLKIF